MTALFALILLLCYFTLKICTATDTLTAAKFLKDPETMTSSNNSFTLGFFSPPNSTHRYVGIWYSKPSVRDVVWVANRNNPLNDTFGIFKVSKDGNLQVLNGKNQILWSSNVSNRAVSGFSAAAQILDSGNLVVRIKDDVIWQSFDHPTDSFLPNMKLTVTKNVNQKTALQSWKSPSDPSDGRFTIGFDSFTLPQVFVWDGDHPHWRSGPWNGNILIGVQYNFIDFINAQLVISSDKKGTISLSYFYPNKSLLSTYLLSSAGEFTQIWWDEGKRSWEVEVQVPATECDLYGKCGAFGTLHRANSEVLAWLLAIKQELFITMPKCNSVSTAGTDNKVKVIIAVTGSLLGMAVVALLLCFMWKRRGQEQGNAPLVHI